MTRPGGGHEPVTSDPCAPCHGLAFGPCTPMTSRTRCPTSPGTTSSVPTPSPSRRCNGGVGPRTSPGCTRWASLAGNPLTQAWADDAHRDIPRLRTHDRTGQRVDEVDYSRAYHDLMRVAVGHGLTAEAWTQPADSGAHLRRAAGFVTWSRAEAGHLCPVSMTYAAAPALRSTPALADRWVPLLASRDYDPALRAFGERTSAIAGMGMTEKQGGSDVRANATRAEAFPGGPIEGGDTYRLTGHKWFFSAPMSDVFLVLATTAAGVTCFLVPRILDDGTRNALRLQRLKDKARQPLERLLRGRGSRRRGRCGSARTGGASAPSSRWSPRPGWTASWAPRRRCGRR